MTDSNSNNHHKVINDSLPSKNVIRPKSLSLRSSQRPSVNPTDTLHDVSQNTKNDETSNAAKCFNDYSDFSKLELMTSSTTALTPSGLKDRLCWNRANQTEFNFGESISNSGTQSMPNSPFATPNRTILSPSQQTSKIPTLKSEKKVILDFVHINQLTLF